MDLQCREAVIGQPLRRQSLHSAALTNSCSSSGWSSGTARVHVKLQPGQSPSILQEYFWMFSSIVVLSVSQKSTTNPPPPPCLLRASVLAIVECLSVRRRLVVWLCDNDIIDYLNITSLCSPGLDILAISICKCSVIDVSCPGPLPPQLGYPSSSSPFLSVLCSCKAIGCQGYPCLWRFPD